MILGNIPPLVCDKQVKYTPDVDVKSMSPGTKKYIYRTAKCQRKKRQLPYDQPDDDSKKQ